jgi:PAS domain S-box-containing protein
MATTDAATAAAGAAPPQPPPPPTLLPALDASSLAALERGGANTNATPLPFAYLVADARKRDYPIVHCSPGFTRLTGYPAEEVLGRNCRFLQGPGTSRRKVAAIRDALREERACHVCLLNYKRDGTPFWNLFHMAPVKQEASRQGGGGGGETLMYIGVQTDVTELVEKARARRAAAAAAAGGGAAAAAAEQEEDEEAEARAAADSVAEEARAAAEGDARRLSRALSRAALLGERPAEDTSDEEEVAALSSLEEGEAVAVARALCSRDADEEGGGGGGGEAGEQPFPAVPARLLSHLFRVQSAFVLSDARRDDCPIVFASDAFCAMTGFPREEVVGRNCRFLQQRRTVEAGGEGGDNNNIGGVNQAAREHSARELERLRTALKSDPPQPATVTLLNYKRDGSAFWNALHVAPVRDADGRVEFFVGVQLDVTASAGAGAGAAAGAGSVADEASLPPPPAAGGLSLPQRMAHSGATGAVRVACRSLMGEAGGLRRAAGWQALPKRGCSKQQQGGGGGGGGGSGEGP